jgi:hypothetical protein
MRDDEHQVASREVLKLEGNQLRDQQQSQEVLDCA